jgi:hypothetical protein
MTRSAISPKTIGYQNSFDFPQIMLLHQLDESPNAIHIEDIPRTCFRI